MRLVTFIICAIDTLFLGLALYEAEALKHSPPSGTFLDLFNAVLGLAGPPALVAVFLLTVLPALFLVVSNRAPTFALLLSLITPALVAAGWAWLSS